MTPTSRADLHVHSTASMLSKLGVQRSLGLPECATPPADVLELAERRGMDFVTICDHDTIAGAQQIADDPRVFLSEELTVAFKGEPQAVHVLCLGITPDDHAWLQAHRDDVERVAEHLRERDITCALAHPFYAVAAPLTPRHRRRLAELFPIWETRNGSRAAELNAPAAIYIETHGGTGVGGSDDHAGVDVGRTFTEVPRCATPQEFLAHVRAGRASAGGEQGSAAKWAHAAMALTVRALGRDAAGRGATRPNPAAVWSIVQRVLGEGAARSGEATSELAASDAKALLDAWLASVGLDLDAPQLLALLQDDGFRHADLYRRARRAHERGLAAAVDQVLAQATSPEPDLGTAAAAVFDACLAAIPYAPAAAFLGQEKRKLAPHAERSVKVALVVDGVGGMHGVTHTVDELRERGVPGYDVEVVGTDPNVDRRLGEVARVAIPFYPGLEIGVPSLPAIVETLADGHYDLVHLVSPGPCGVAAAMVARVMDLPVLGSYHTELAAYAQVRAADPRLEIGMRMALAAFYGQCRHVLSPSPQADAALLELGVDPAAVGRWDRGVDVARFTPGRRVAGLLGPDDRVHVLYAGRLTREKGSALLAESFLAARRRDPRLHLVLAGGGAEEPELRARLGEHATFLGWQAGEELARTYASADAFLFCSQTDTFGQVLLEAQASGLPVVAVAAGGPVSLVQDGVSGLLRAGDADALAEAVCRVTAEPLLRERLAAGGMHAVAERTWDRALGRLAAGYGRALAAHAAAAHARAAA